MGGWPWLDQTQRSCDLHREREATGPGNVGPPVESSRRIKEVKNDIRVIFLCIVFVLARVVWGLCDGWVPAQAQGGGSTGYRKGWGWAGWPGP